MATNIPLYQRTELPPARAGEAKLPYELADMSGQVQFGQTLAKFGGAIWDKLIKAQAANEEAEARGQVNTFIESFSTFVADRPNASPEELQKEWDKISARIKAIPGTLKTRIAEANFTNFLALNEGLINQRAQTSMEAIKSRQELGRFNAGREQAMTNFDIPGLTAIYEAQFESGLLEEETGRIQLENDIAQVIKEQIKTDIWRQATTIVRPDGEVDWAEAVKWFAQAENIKGIPSDIIDGLLENAKTQATLQQKRDSEKLALAKTQTATKMLIDLWDNKLVDPQVITDALRKDLISDTNAKYLREALLNPEPPKTDLKALAESLIAITDLGRGALTEDQALDVIYKNVNRLDPKKGESLVAKIIGEQDKHDSDMKSRGQGFMEELIRDKDPISGMFTDDERQILGTAEGIIELEASIENAARTKKPLERTNLLIEAIRIGRAIKGEISKEEVPPFKYEKKKRVITDEEVEAALKIGKKWIPDDTRYYIEPPPLRDKIPNWMKLPKKRRKELWEMYERGEGILFDYTKEGAKITIMTATNPTTGERIISRDGGKTWQELP